MRQSIKLMGPLTALALSACGGGGSSGSMDPVSSNAAPSVTGLAESTTVLQDASSEPVMFSIKDDATAADDLTVTVASSNEDLMPAAGIQVYGYGNDRMLTMVPQIGKSGSAEVTVSVKDAQGAVTSKMIALEVTSEEKSFHDFAVAQIDSPEDATPTEVAGVAWVDTEEDDPTAFDPVLGPIAD